MLRSSQSYTSNLMKKGGGFDVSFRRLLDKVEATQTSVDDTAADIARLLVEIELMVPPRWPGPAMAERRRADQNAVDIPRRIVRRLTREALLSNLRPPERRALWLPARGKPMESIGRYSSLDQLPSNMTLSFRHDRWQLESIGDPPPAPRRAAWITPSPLFPPPQPGSSTCPSAV